MGASIGTLAVGCGGHTSATGTQTVTPIERPTLRHHSAYETAMQVLGNRLALVLEESGITVRSQGATTDEIVRALRTAQHQLRVSAAALAKLRPPGEIVTFHDRLIKGVRDFATELDGVIASARSGTDGIRIAAEIPTLKGLIEMQHASDAITRAGYVIVVHAHSG
jgi:hypothetical protein